MRSDAPAFRSNWYPSGVYLDSLCVWCGRMLRHTGANSGVTWSPIVPLGYAGDWSTCLSNEVGRAAYSGHEPWEAIRIPFAVTIERVHTA